MNNEIDPNYEAVADLIRTIEGKQPLGMVQTGGEQEITNEQRRRVMYILASQKPCIKCSADPTEHHASNYWNIPEALRTPEQAAIFFNSCIVCRLSLGFFTWVAATLTSRLEARR